MRRGEDSERPLIPVPERRRSDDGAPRFARGDDHAAAEAEQETRPRRRAREDATSTSRSHAEEAFPNEQLAPTGRPAGATKKVHAKRADAKHTNVTSTEARAGRQTVTRKAGAEER